jgi:hypothetical protein
MDNSKYGKYIITDLKTSRNTTPEYEAFYATWAKRVLWMDDDVVPGAFQMNCSWYCKPTPENIKESAPHSHDCDEIIGFFSGNPDKPYDLGAEIEFWIEDEMHVITTSALIFMPKGMKHCPLKIRRIDKPVFHFTVLTGSHYISKKD